MAFEDIELLYQPGALIFVGVLFVISFPPLFGHEVVGVLCGVVYGLWYGFIVLSVGTILGEVGNFVLFKMFKGTAEKYERKSLNYACMAHIVREGGFMVILLARFSAIPGHFTTAVFATVGMNLFIFTLAAIISLPKQLAVVYLGVAIASSADGQESGSSKAVKYIVLLISAVVTIGAAWYLYRKMDQARPTVQARLRQRRFTMLTEARYTEAEPGEEGDSPGASSSKLYGSGAPGIYSRDDLGYDATGEHTAQRSSGNWSRWAHKGSNADDEAIAPASLPYEARTSMLAAAAAPGRSVPLERRTPSQDTLNSSAAHEAQALTQAPAASYGRAGPTYGKVPVRQEPQQYEMDVRGQAQEDQYMYDQPNQQQQQQRYAGASSSRPPPAPSAAAAAAVEQQQQLAPQIDQHYQHHSQLGSVYSLPPGSEDLGRGAPQGAGYASDKRAHAADAYDDEAGRPPVHRPPSYTTDAGQLRADPNNQRWSLHDGRAM